MGRVIPDRDNVIAPSEDSTGRMEFAHPSSGGGRCIAALVHINVWMEASFSTSWLGDKDRGRRCTSRRILSTTANRPEAAASARMLHHHIPGVAPNVPKRGGPQFRTCDCNREGLGAVAHSRPAASVDRRTTERGSQNRVELRRCDAQRHEETGTTQAEAASARALRTRSEARMSKLAIRCTNDIGDRLQSGLQSRTQAQSTREHGNTQRAS